MTDRPGRTTTDVPCPVCIEEGRPCDGHNGGPCLPIITAQEQREGKIYVEGWKDGYRAAKAQMAELHSKDT